MSDDDDPVEYSLVMPFVVCAFQGGPFDDDAYVAGWQLGKVDEQLERAVEGHEWSHIVATIFDANIPQADLLAMKHGFSASVMEKHDGGWSDVMFSPPIEWRPDRWEEVPDA